MLRVALAVVFALLAGVAQDQSWLDQPGVAGSIVVSVGKSKIRLPPGEWRQVANHDYSNGNQAVTIIERLFIQSDGKHVIAIAYVRGNNGGSFSKGFRPIDSCFRSDVFFNDSQDLYPGQWDCIIVNHNMMTWRNKIPTMWQAAMDQAEASGGLPRPMVYVELSKADPSRNDFAVLSIAVNPAVDGFPSSPDTAWAESEWNKNHIASDRAAFLKKLAAWGAAYRPIFRKSWE